MAEFGGTCLLGKCPAPLPTLPTPPLPPGSSLGGPLSQDLSAPQIPGLPGVGGLFIHRVAFEEVSGHRVLLKCGPGNWGLSACCTTH